MARRRTVESERIRQAAAELLAVLPPAEVTVAAVAAAAGVSTGTVYNYFRNKEHLLAAAAGVPGALSAWAEPEPGQGRREHLTLLAATALERFRLIGGSAIGGSAIGGSAIGGSAAGGSACEASGILAAEVEWLTARLSATLAAESGDLSGRDPGPAYPERHARLVSRVFYGGVAAAVLLGWKREDDGDFASMLASLVVPGQRE